MTSGRRKGKWSSGSCSSDEAVVGHAACRRYHLYIRQRMTNMTGVSGGGHGVRRRDPSAHLYLCSSSALNSWVEASLTRPLDHIRHLTLDENSRRWITPYTFDNISTSFGKIESLELPHLKPARFNEWSPSESFSDNLTSLVIRGSTTDVEMLRSFICTFPNLDNLEFDDVYMTGDMTASPSPTTTPRFRGKLTLQNIGCDGPCVTDPLLRGSLLPMAFSDLCVVGCGFREPQSLKDLFVACSETVKKLKLFVAYFKVPGGSFHRMSLNLIFFNTS